MTFGFAYSFGTIGFAFLLLMLPPSRQWLKEQFIVLRDCLKPEPPQIAEVQRDGWKPPSFSQPAAKGFTEAERRRTLHLATKAGDRRAS